jgi:formylglycine-generating enzyme required for sulfatase activity
MNNIINLKFNSKENYILFLFVYLLNITFLVSEKFIIFPFLGAFQAIDGSLISKNFFYSIFNLHSQPPLWNFFVGIIYKFAEIFSSPIFYSSLLNGKFIKDLPINYQSTAYIIFWVFFFILPIQGVLIFKILNRFLSNFTAYICVFIYMLSPIVVYLTLWISWEFLFSFLLTLLIYFLLCFKTIKFKKIYSYFIFLSIIVCLLFLHRSTFKIPIIILIFIYVIVNFREYKNYVYKFFIIPTILIYLLFSAKNFFIAGNFKIETQSIYHLSHSMGPFLIKDPLFYHKLKENEKNLIKNSNLGLLAGINHYSSLGFNEKKEKKNKFFEGGNNLVLADAHNSYSRVLLNSVSNKTLLEFYNYLNASYNYYFSWNAGEGIEILGSTFFNIFLDIQNNYLKYNYFIISFIFVNIIYKIVNYKNAVKNQKYYFLFFFDLFTLYFILVTGALAINGNSRYRFACEPIYFIYFIINIIELKNNFFKRNYLYFSLLVIFFLIFYKSNFILKNLNTNDFVNKTKLFDTNGIPDPSTFQLEKNINFLKKNFYYVDDGEVITSPDPTYYWTKTDKRFVKGFYVLKKNVSLGDYIIFLEDNNFNVNLPFWWNKNISVKDNINFYISFYKITDFNFSEYNYPVTGVTYLDAKSYSKWFSKKYKLNSDIISDTQWSRALDYFLNINNDKNKIFNTLYSKENRKHNLYKIISNVELEKNFSSYVGNVWQWVEPTNKIIYTLDNGNWSVNFKFDDIKNINSYKFISDDYAYLRGGSYTTIGPAALHYSSAKLIFGKKMTDEDVGFRIVVNK